MEEILAQSNQIQSFVKSSYEMNVNTLVQRNKNISTIGDVMMVTFIGFFMFLVATRIGIMKKLLRQMKIRKMI